MNWLVAGAVVPGLLVSWAVACVMRRVAPAIGLVDRPGLRKVHVETKPYGGGVAIWAGIVVPLFKRLRVSPVLGFLAAGVALGPYGLGGLAGGVSWLSQVTVSNPAEIAQMAEFGVVFLLFMIGLEIDLKKIVRDKIVSRIREVFSNDE